MSIAASWSSQHDGPWVRPQDRDDWRLGAILAAGAHLALVGALALGVSWKSDPPQVAEAELWATVPTVAAPPAPPPTPPSPAPEPVVREVSPPPEPEPVRAAPQADLGITPPREVFDTTPPKRPAPQPEPKPEPKPKPPLKPEPKPEPKKATPPPPKPATTSQPETRMTAAEREAQRQANLMRMMSELGSLGTSGQDAQSAGPSSNYAGRIKARIKPNIVFTEWTQGNPVAVVEVRCAPDGRILSSRLLTSSGVPAWDAAVLRAVERTEVLPANEQGKVPAAIVIEFRPRD
ncbi:MAG: energy transducer TonB [Aquabacterium sp.]|jgi:colicin import membrane protein